MSADVGTFYSAGLTVYNSLQVHQYTNAPIHIIQCTNATKHHACCTVAAGQQMLLWYSVLHRWTRVSRPQQWVEKQQNSQRAKCFPQIISPAVKLMSKFNFLTYLRFTLDKLANLVLSFLTKVFTCLLSSISTIGTYWYRDRLQVRYHISKITDAVPPILP